MSAVRGVPHPFPYQGSKRQLARQIVSCVPAQTKRLIEPFVGSGAITLATAIGTRPPSGAAGEVLLEVLGQGAGRREAR